MDLVRQVRALADRRNGLDFPYLIEGRLFLGGSLRSFDFEKRGTLGGF